MKKRRDSDLIDDILHAANLARNFVEGFTLGQFEADLRTVQEDLPALVTALETEGKALLAKSLK